MNTKERIELAHELIKTYSLRLADIAHHVGVNDPKRAAQHFEDVLKDAFADEVAEALERERKEEEFIASGEAAIENKADAARAWYRELMDQNRNND